MILSLVSAALLGFYEVFKKQSVQDNAVIPVLFVAICVSSFLWMFPTLLSATGQIASGPLYVAPLPLRGHLELLAKSLLVGSSWILAYFALKHLPVSLAGPIRASSPAWTLLGAVVVLAERPSPGQWAGILLAVASFLALSLVGKKEGIPFHRNPWIGAIFAATILGATSSLYDRYLLSLRGYSVPVVQAWFSHYLVLVMAPAMLGWSRRWWPRGPFHWRWSIPLIAFSLLGSDYLYFMAIRDPEALVAVVSSLRRAAVVIPFAAGFLLFGERNFLAKLPCVAGIVLGICLLLSNG